MPEPSDADPIGFEDGDAPQRLINRAVAITTGGRLAVSRDDENLP